MSDFSNDNYEEGYLGTTAVIHDYHSVYRMYRHMKYLKKCLIMKLWVRRMEVSILVRNTTPGASVQLENARNSYFQYEKKLQLLNAFLAKTRADVKALQEILEIRKDMSAVILQQLATRGPPPGGPGPLF